jgi:hypothetical protein
MVPGTDSGGRFASDSNRGRWCLAPIPWGDLLAILAGPLVPGTDSGGPFLAPVPGGRFASDPGGADGAWHRFRGAIC